MCWILKLLFVLCDACQSFNVFNEKIMTENVMFTFITFFNIYIQDKQKITSVFQQAKVCNKIPADFVFKTDRPSKRLSEAPSRSKEHNLHEWWTCDGDVYSLEESGYPDKADICLYSNSQNIWLTRMCGLQI